MQCKKCKSEVDNDRCSYKVEHLNVSVKGPCPHCGYGYLGNIRITEDQYNAYYHDMPYDFFKLAKVVNHSLWTNNAPA